MAVAVGQMRVLCIYWWHISKISKISRCERLYVFLKPVVIVPDGFNPVGHEVLSPIEMLTGEFLLISGSFCEKLNFFCCWALYQFSLQEMATIVNRK